MLVVLITMIFFLLLFFKSLNIVSCFRNHHSCGNATSLILSFTSLFSITCFFTIFYGCRCFVCSGVYSFPLAVVRSATFHCRSFLWSVVSSSLLRLLQRVSSLMFYLGYLKTSRLNKIVRFSYN